MTELGHFIVTAQDLKELTKLFDNPDAPIIFLDFDGVLNHFHYWQVARNREHGLDDERNHFDPACVENLNLVIEQTGAKVVVSSTWRLGRTIQQLQELLDSVGFKGEVVGKTKDLRSNETKRGQVIERYVQEHNVRKYVILDDDTDFLEHQRPYFVQTSAYKGGLTIPKRNETLSILRK